MQILSSLFRSVSVTQRIAHTRCHRFMKPFLCLLAVICSFNCVIISCKKEQVIRNKTLLGTWELTELHTAITTANPKYQSGSLQTFFRFTPTDSLYRLFVDVSENTRLINVTDSNFLTEDRSQRYRYSIRGDVLDMVHIQDSGTRYIFKKVKE